MKISKSGQLNMSESNGGNTLLRDLLLDLKALVGKMPRQLPHVQSN